MNPKPKATPGAEDTQQFSAADVKAEGLKQYRSPRNQQQQPPQPQNVAVQITAMLVILAFFIALIIAGVVITLNIIH